MEASRTPGEPLIREVPTHIFQFQEKIWIWTIPQLLYDCVGAVGVWFLLHNEGLPLFLRIVLGTGLALLIVCVVHVTIHKRSFLEWVLLMGRFAATPRRAIWQSPAVAAVRPTQTRALATTQDQVVSLHSLVPPHALAFTAPQSRRAPRAGEPPALIASAFEVHGVNFGLLSDADHLRLFAGFEELLLTNEDAFMTYTTNELLDPDTYPPLDAASSFVHTHLHDTPGLAPLAHARLTFTRSQVSGGLRTRHFVVVQVMRDDLIARTDRGTPRSAWSILLLFAWLRKRSSLALGDMQERLQIRVQALQEKLTADGFTTQLLTSEEYLALYRAALAPGSALQEPATLHEELHPIHPIRATPSPHRAAEGVPHAPMPPSSSPTRADGEDEAPRSTSAIPLRAHRHTGTTSRPAASTPAPSRNEHVQELLLFGAGVRSLRDLVAPTAIETHRDAYLVERGSKRCYVRYVSLVSLSRRITSDALSRIIGLPLPLTVAMHLFPCTNATMLALMERQALQIKSHRLGSALSKELEKAALNFQDTDTERIRTGIAGGTIKIASVSLTIGVSAGTLDELDTHYASLLMHLRQNQFTVQTCTWLHDVAYQTSLPIGVDLLHHRVNLDNGSLSMLLPFFHAGSPSIQGPLLGKTPNGQLVHWYPWDPRLLNGHMTGVGETGSGKSYLTKAALMGLICTGKVDAVVMDRYDDWLSIHRHILQHQRAGSPPESQHFDLKTGCPFGMYDLPFVAEDVFESLQSNPRGDLLADHIANHLTPLYGTLISDTQHPFSREEAGLLQQVTLQLYERAGLSWHEIRQNPALALSRPEPTFSDLLTELATPHTTRSQTLCMSLVARLYPFAAYFPDRSYFELSSPLTIFSIKDLDESLYALATYAIKNAMQRNRAQLRYRRMLVHLIEEASFLLNHPVTRRYLEHNARGLRRQAVAQWTVSQHPDDFLDTGKIILANAGTTFFLHMPETALNRLALPPAAKKFLQHARPGDCLMHSNNAYTAFRVQASPLEHTLYNTNPLDATPQQRVATT